MHKRQNLAILAALLSKIVRPGNRAGVFIWQIFILVAEICRNRDLVNRADPPSHMSDERIEIYKNEVAVWPNLSDLASPVNRAHMKDLMCKLLEIYRVDHSMGFKGALSRILTDF